MNDVKNVILVSSGKGGVGKTELAKKIQEALPESLYINSDEERVKAKNVDYSIDGQSRHTYRILEIARKNRSNNIIIDMSCPLEDSRDILNPDVIVWVDTKKDSGVPAWEEQFEPPKLYDLKFKAIDEDTLSDIIEKIKTKRV